MTKKTIGLIGAIITSIAGAAHANDIIKGLQTAGVESMTEEGQFEVGVDSLYDVTKLAQHSGLEISVLGASQQYGKINVQLGKSNTLNEQGAKVFTPKTLKELNMFGKMVVN